MKIPRQLFFMGGIILSTLLVSAPVFAECGGNQQCMAVSIDTGVAPAHGTPLVSSTLNFGSAAVGATSVTRTILAAAVLGPAGTYAILDAIALGGTDAADFSITGGSCTVGTPTLLHDGAATAQLSNTCTITITFNPTTSGVKSATLAVTTAAITRTVPLAGTSGYPNPAQDMALVGMVTAQVDTAQRFAKAQIENFQHRMESLHRGANSATSVASSSGADASSNALIDTYAKNLVALLTTQSLNLATLTDQGAVTSTSGNTPGRNNFWAAGKINFGTRSATNSANELRFVSDGISLGFDHRFSEQSALGIGLGFARDQTDIGDAGSYSRAAGSSVAIYGSYQPSRKIFVDGLIGIGALKFETQRYVSAVNDYARSDRDADQIFGSLATGYEYRDNSLLWSPYARLDYSTIRLKQSAETGADQFDLRYFSQTSSATQGALGIRAASVHPTSFGSVAPRIRAEYQHNFQGVRQSTVAYADQAGGPVYAIPSEAAARNLIMLGVGNDFVMRGGAKFGIDYQVLHAFSQDTNYSVLLQFSSDFDERDLAVLPGKYTGSLSAPLGIQVDAAYKFDDNVTRANSNKLVDSSYNFNLGKTVAVPVSDHTRVLLTGTLGSEKFYRYDGLSRISGGMLGEFQYRSSSDFSAPTFGIFARTFIDQYNSEFRDGYRYTTGISMLQPVTDRINLFSAVAHNQRYGKNAVFDNRDNSARFNLDYQLSAVSTIYLGGEYRRGDVVSAGSAPSVYGAGSVSVADDAYPGGQLFSFRLDGSTVLTTLGYNLGLGARDSLDFSWRRIRSELETAGYSGPYSAPTSYTSNQYLLSYLVRF